MTTKSILREWKPNQILSLARGLIGAAVFSAGAGRAPRISRKLFGIKMTKIAFLIAAAVIQLYGQKIALGASVVAGNYTYTTLDEPSGANFLGINNKGQVVGYYNDTPDVFHGFILDINKKTYTILDEPHAVLGGGDGTFAMGINDGGQVVGYYNDNNPTAYYAFRPTGFIYSNGAYTTLDDPFGVSNSDFVYPHGINNSGSIIGFVGYVGLSEIYGFLNSIRLQDPLSPDTTEPVGINNSGQVVGNIALSAYTTQGFLYQGGVFTSLPNSLSDNILPNGINNTGQIAGIYVDSYGSLNGFVYDIRTNTYTTLHFPGAQDTEVRGINDSGQVVGTYTDPNYHLHGFVATPNGSPSPQPPHPRT